jgi:hypothetical protein
VAFDGVPWAISGSKLDTFVMREFANMATRGAAGIQLPGDGKVTALGTPAGSVNIAPGGLVIPNVQAASAGRGESYVGRIASQTNIAVPPTSGAGRSDMIIATIRDPDFSPWSPYTLPNDILFGPYFYPERISGVSPTATLASQVVSYSAYALARIDIPPSTTNITNAMITDLRGLAQPRIGFAKAVHLGPGTQDNLALTDTSWRNWPTDSLSVAVPSWATHCMASIRLLQIQASGASDFQSSILMGGLRGTGVNFDYNGALQTAVPGAVEGIPFEIFADMDVRTIAGTTVTVSPQAMRTFTANTGTLWYNNRQQIVYDLCFVERAV